jgi:hypothetical protein
MISHVSVSAGVGSVAAGTRGGMRQGDLPVFSWKGENPVDAFTVFMMAKWTRGSFASQPFWLLLTWLD